MTNKEKKDKEFDLYCERVHAERITREEYDEKIKKVIDRLERECRFHVGRNGAKDKWHDGVIRGIDFAIQVIESEFN